MMRLRLMPLDGQGQRVDDWQVTVNGDPVTSFRRNSFGVPEAVWRTGQRIRQAVIVAEGTVSTVDQAGIVGFCDEDATARVFLRPSDATLPSPALQELAAAARSGDGALATLHDLSRLVHERLTYRAETTDSTTTAAEALELGCGVCQDFAHVFIACARELGIPARYVAGYVFDPDAPVETHESHGWAEAFVEGLGWIGFDPARKVCVTDHYIRLSWGMDAFDAAPIRGVAQVAGTIGLHVDVVVAEAPQKAQSQSQQQ